MSIMKIVCLSFLGYSSGKKIMAVTFDTACKMKMFNIKELWETFPVRLCCNVVKFCKISSNFFFNNAAGLSTDRKKAVKNGIKMRYLNTLGLFYRMIFFSFYG